MLRKSVLDVSVFVCMVVGVGSAVACFRSTTKNCCDLLPPGGYQPVFGGSCPSIITSNPTVNHIRNAVQYEIGQVDVTLGTQQSCVWWHRYRLPNGNCLTQDPQRSANCTPESPAGASCWGSGSGE
jgi:hypothetical protein